MFTKVKLGLAAAFLAASTIIISPVPAIATTIPEYNSMSDHDQAVLITDYVHKVIEDIKGANPQLAEKIHDYFFKKDIKTGVTEGGKDLFNNVDSFQKQLESGRTELAKLKVEALVWICIEDKFNVSMSKVNGHFIVTPNINKIAATPATQPTTQPTSVVMNNTSPSATP